MKQKIILTYWKLYFPDNGPGRFPVRKLSTAPFWQIAKGRKTSKVSFRDWFLSYFVCWQLSNIHCTVCHVSTLLHFLKVKKMSLIVWNDKISSVSLGWKLSNVFLLFNKYLSWHWRLSCLFTEYFNMLICLITC